MIQYIYLVLGYKSVILLNIEPGHVFSTGAWAPRPELPCRPGAPRGLRVGFVILGRAVPTKDFFAFMLIWSEELACGEAQPFWTGAFIYDQLPTLGWCLTKKGWQSDLWGGCLQHSSPPLHHEHWFMKIRALLMDNHGNAIDPGRLWWCGCYVGCWAKLGRTVCKRTRFESQVCVWEHDLVTNRCHLVGSRVFLCVPSQGQASINNRRWLQVLFCPAQASLPTLQSLMVSVSLFLPLWISEVFTATLRSSAICCTSLSKWPGPKERQVAWGLVNTGGLEDDWLLGHGLLEIEVFAVNLFGLQKNTFAYYPLGWTKKIRHAAGSVGVIWVTLTTLIVSLQCCNVVRMSVVIKGSMGA